MSRLPVNASSEASARRIAEHAAKTQVPEGMTMTVGNLVAVEPGRPFAEVALAERYITGVPQQTYVFEVTIGKVARCKATYGTMTLVAEPVQCELAEGHGERHGNSFAARYWD